MSIRYKILIALTLASGYSYGQGTPLNVQRSSSVVTVNDSRFRAKLNLGLPLVTDTASALMGGLDSLGLIVQIRTSGLLYVRDTVATGGHKWTNVAASGTSIPTGTDFSVVRDNLGAVSLYNLLQKNIKDFNAVGDGSHDDAPAFIAAGNSVYKNIYIPPGRYRLGSQINIVGNGIHWTGNDSLSRLISDPGVATTMFLGYDIHDLYLSHFAIVNQSPGGGGCIYLNQDTALTGVSTHVSSNINLSYIEMTAPGTGDVIAFSIIAHRSGFGGSVYNVNLDHVNIHNVSSAGVSILTESTGKWLRDFNLTNSRIDSTGVVDSTNGFGVTISGLAPNMNLLNNTIRNYSKIGTECAGCVQSSINYNTYAKGRNGLEFTCPFTFNSNPSGASGFDNQAIGNKTLDTVPYAGYFINQVNLKLSNNTIYCDSQFVYFDTVRNSNFDNNTYVMTGSPRSTIRLDRSSNITLSKINLLGNVSQNQAILIANHCQNITFENPNIVGPNVRGTIINSDTGSHNIVIHNMTWANLNSNGIEIMDTTLSAAWDVVLDANYHQKITAHGGGIWQRTGTNQINVANPVSDSVTVGNGVPLDRFTLFGGLTIKQLNINPLATNVYGQKIVVGENTTGGTNLNLYGLNISPSVSTGDSVAAFNGIYIDPTVSFAGRMGAYTGITLNGPGSNNIGAYKGLFLPDGTMSSGGNYQGIYSSMTAGSGKAALWGQGGALMYQNGQFFIGSVSSGHPGSLLHLASTTQALRITTMTGAQMNAISSPEAGDVVACSDSGNAICYYDGSAWRRSWYGATGGGMALTYPNTINKYLNGYGSFATLNADSIGQGSTNKYFVAADTTNLSHRIDTVSAKSFGLYVQKDGGRGINLLRGHDSVLVMKGKIDSLDHHSVLNADSTVTDYVEAHDTVSANALQPKFRSDSARANMYAALSLKKNANDSAANSSPGFVTQASRRKLEDSILAVSVAKNTQNFPAEQPYGLIYDKSNWPTNSADFAILPSVTGGTNGTIATFSAGALTLSSSNASWGSIFTVLPDRPTLQVPSSDTSWITVTNAITANSVGVGLAAVSYVQNSVLSYKFYINVSTSNNGKITAGTDNGTAIGSAVTGTAVSANDKLQMALSRIDDSTLVFSYRNLTTASAWFSKTVSFALPIGSTFASNTWNWGFISFSATPLATTYTVQRIKISSTAVRYMSNMFAGTSKMRGTGGLTFGQSFVTTLGNTYPTCTNFGDGGGTLADLLRRRDEILASDPQVFILEHCNDTRFGFTVAQTENMINTIAGWFKGTQTQFYVTVFPEDSVGAGVGSAPHLTDLKNYDSITFGNHYIDNWNRFTSGGNIILAPWINGDHIHPTQAFYTSVDSLFRTLGILKTADPTRYSPFTTYDHQYTPRANSFGPVYKFERRKNYMLKVNDSLDVMPSMSTDDGQHMIVSRNQSAVPPSASIVNVLGALQISGVNGALILRDNVLANTDSFALIPSNNQLEFAYNGLPTAYINTLGQLLLTNASATQSSAFQIHGARTYTASQLATGWLMNFDAATHTASIASAGLSEANMAYLQAQTLNNSSGSYTKAATLKLDSVIATGGLVIANSFALRTNGRIEHNYIPLAYGTPTILSHQADSGVTQLTIGSGLSVSAGVLSATGGSGITRISPIDSLTKSSNGVQVSGVSLVPQSGDASFPGLITTGTQTIAGVKTFTSSPIVPTATALDNSTKAASTAYADNAATAAVSSVVTAGKILPTATAVTNIATVSADSSSYTKVFNTVTARFPGTAIATAGSAFGSFTMTVPVTNITWNTEFVGSGTWYDITAGTHIPLMVYFSSPTTITVTGTFPSTNTGHYVVVVQYDAQ